MNVKDCQHIYMNLVAAIQAGRDYDAYAWVRLLCRQLRPLTVKRLNGVNREGPHDWL